MQAKWKLTCDTDKIEVSGLEYAINDEFRHMAMSFAEEFDLDEMEAASYLLDSLEDQVAMGRSLAECAIVRFHRQRRYLLESVKLLLELANRVEPDEEEGEETAGNEEIQNYVGMRLFPNSASGPKRMVVRCMAAMSLTKKWLLKVNDKVIAAQTLGTTISEEMETVEFSRISLLEQHETLAIIQCHCVEMHRTEKSDFVSLISTLKQADKYDMTLIHLIPALGAYISRYGSTEGGHDLRQARQLNDDLFSAADESTWPLPSLKALVRSWWLAEYSEFYLDDPPENLLPPNTNLEEEDRQRSKQFFDCLKDGAFDLLLAISGDVKARNWQDPVRSAMRKWLQPKSPALAADSVEFSKDFENCLQTQLEIFVDAFISNLPDVLRKLRIEEDEQRQLSQTHEQDLDLERFLFIIAYAYDGRPEVAARFWTDQTSNLYGFMLWVSKRASTPLVTSFCEMLQAIAANEECATAAHELLLDDGHHASGKMAKSQSLTWAQIFKELQFFADKIKQGPKPVSSGQARNKAMNEMAETEPESVLMLECYLRLITKLATESEAARLFLLADDHTIVHILFDLASGNIFSRLRGCIFLALKALMTRKTSDQGKSMWLYLDFWVSGGNAGQSSQQRGSTQSNASFMDRTFVEMSQNFDNADPLVQLLTALVSPGIDNSPLNDSLPYSEDIGSSSRVAGIDIYIDFVMGLVFSSRSTEFSDPQQNRVLKLSCLEFVQQCLSTFNEDLIIMANETTIPVDSVIGTSDLATYVKMHPFARIMEWMFNDKVMAALFDTVQQSLPEVARAKPDSPLIQGILRGVEVISMVLDLQATYLDLVRPFLKANSGQRRQPVANAAYASFEDGLITRINLVVALGNYCGIGHPDLTLACLKLMEKMSSSSKITTAWSGSGRHAHRNKAIVAMEANHEHETITRCFVQELKQPIELGREQDSPAYISKIYILDFMYECLKQSPRRPTIAHLLLGFKCSIDSLSLESNSSFYEPNSLFHVIASILLETPAADATGLHHSPIALKYRAMRIMHLLWSSPLSAPFVVAEMRENNFASVLLAREVVLQPEIPWEGEDITAIDFTLTNGSLALLDFLTLRRMTFEYLATELCIISQGRMPSIKRRMFEALSGQIVAEDNQIIACPTIFDLYDFNIPEDMWNLPEPPLEFYNGVELSICIETDGEGNKIWNVDRVNEILMLKRAEIQGHGTLVTAADAANIEREEVMVTEYLSASNRQLQIKAEALRVLKTWAKLLLVMVQSSDMTGTTQTSFFLQALQAVQPSLNDFAIDRPDEALELATLTKILLYRLNLTSATGPENETSAMGHLVGDKLYQLFQSCLQAIGKWAGTPSLRAIYYEICYRYLTGMVNEGAASTTANRHQTLKTIRHYGERLMNVISDDASCGEPACQTAALILLNGVVSLGRQEGDNEFVETLNKLNFIGCLVDSLRNLMEDWHQAFSSSKPYTHFQKVLPRSPLY